MYCKNYRPISLLNSISKVFDRSVNNILYAYLTENNLLNPKNAGFKKGNSTVNQLLYITDKIYVALDQGHDVRMVFLDAEKAFNKVWHSSWSFKRAQLGVTLDFMWWFDSYLSDRHQRLVINRVAFNLLCLESGVPQGSILGSLLFLIHVNDVTSDIVTDINLFVDDTSLLDVIDNPKSSSERLNYDLSKLNTWASQWLVNFNPSKTVVMSFSTRRKPLTYPPIIS